jgi:hypothetical protein
MKQWFVSIFGIRKSGINILISRSYRFSGS